MSGHVTHAIMLIQKGASVNHSLFKQDPKPFQEEMDAIEEAALGEAYEKKKTVVTNDETYGEDEEEEVEAPSRSNPFGGMNIYTKSSVYPMRVSKATRAFPRKRESKEPEKSKSSSDKRSIHIPAVDLFTKSIEISMF